mmetsp:Transcript_77863/g.166991  ORF Transcript_77863/g.166991 Transcript_77863/m.166991 type:complete len:268 (+) Transcript_77863:1694-2497(+)
MKHLYWSIRCRRINGTTYMMPITRAVCLRWPGMSSASGIRPIASSPSSPSSSPRTRATKAAVALMLVKSRRLSTMPSPPSPPSPSIPSPSPSSLGAKTTSMRYICRYVVRKKWMPNIWSRMIAFMVSTRTTSFFHINFRYSIISEMPLISSSLPPLSRSSNLLDGNVSASMSLTLHLLRYLPICAPLTVRMTTLNSRVAFQDSSIITGILSSLVVSPGSKVTRPLEAWYFFPALADASSVWYSKEATPMASPSLATSMSASPSASVQ